MASKLCPHCMKSSESDVCPHCGKDVNYAGSPAHLPAGYVVSGKHPYVLGAALGQGGFGITYIALDMVSGERVAIKEYYPSYCSTRADSATVTAYSSQEEVYEKGRARFLEEARTLKTLSDLPNIVNVLDFFEANNTAYLVMEFLEGCSLKEYAAENGTFPAQSFLQKILPLMDDIHQMHNRGVIHRDIAPDNIILLPDGQMKLIDFGAARFYLGDKSMTVVVKKGFAPVEQYAQNGDSGPWTDIYSLAATIYYCITGTVPPAAVERIDKDTVLWNLPAFDHAPPFTADALRKAMSIQVKDRHQSMAEFAAALRNPSRVKRPFKKWIGMAAALLAVIVTVAVLFGNASRKPADTPADVQMNTTQETEAPEEPWVKNVLSVTELPVQTQTEIRETSVFGSSVTRDCIVSVTFLDSLEDAPRNSWDISLAHDDSILYWMEPAEMVEFSDWGEDFFDIITYEKQGYDLYIAAEGGINGKYCATLFKGFCSLKSIRFNGCFHTDYAESMEDMFYDCYSLTELDVSELKTDRVCSMKGMFFNCGSLTQLNVSHFDTSKVTSMSQMFDSCVSLTALDLQNFDTSKVTDMSEMFSLTAALTDLDLSSFDTANVTNMHSMFSHAGAQHLDLSHFNTDAVTRMDWMFSHTDALETLDISSFNTSKVESMSGMFANCALTNLDLSHFDTSKVEYMSWMFQSTPNLQELDISSFDTSAVRSMNSMFSGTVLTSLDLTHFNTASVTDMGDMFSGSALETLDVSGFDTSAVEKMDRMFRNCKKLDTIRGISDWDTSSVTDYSNFMDDGKTINGSPWENLFR